MVGGSVRKLGPPLRPAWAAVGLGFAVLWSVGPWGQVHAAPSDPRPALCLDAQDHPRDCAILLVHSYHSVLGWTRKLSYGFSSALRSQGRIRIDTEFLDAKRRPSLPHAEAFLDMLEKKYRAEPPDVLVISDDPAFELLWSRRDTLFPDVPIVFMGLNEVRADLIDAPGVTGIFERHDTEATIRLALALTGAEGIVIINDSSPTGRANEPTLRRMMAAHPDLEWVVERDLALEDIEQLLVHPPDWPLVPMLPLRENGPSGPMISQRRSVELLRASLPHPLFYSADWLMGRGIVGGYMLKSRDHARAAGDLVLRILKGAPPESIPMGFTTPHSWIFDSRELQRFGWDPELLPPGAEIRYAPEGYWSRHHELLLPISALLLAASLIIGGLALLLERQRRAELALRTQKQRLTTALAASDAGFFEIQGGQGQASTRWLELVGVSASGSHDPDLWMRGASSESRVRFVDAVERLSHRPGRERLEIELPSVQRELDVLLTTADGEEGTRRAVVGVGTDITRRRRVEAEASSRTRLQALGKLAGGIAHDFNNILTVINGTAELVREVEDLDEVRSGLNLIEDSGARAAELVRHLLLFGRRDHRAARPSDLNAPIRDMHVFLGRLVGEAHEVVTLLHDEPLGVPLDGANIEQVLSNLVINARDALPGGGPIHVSTSTLIIDAVEWAVLSVRDDGAGMDESTRSRIFEPFFTTKPVGDGSGLGLSTVWGIVSGSGGEVHVDSSPRGGTTITARWMRLPLPSVITEPTTPLPAARARSILLVEDDPGVAFVTESLLQGAGYCVQRAADGREGLRVFQEQPDAFDLVFSDLVLPHLSGVEMVDRIKVLRPSVRVGFLTGYAHHPSLGRVPSPADSELLRKPFSKRELHEYVSARLSRR